MKRKTQRKEKSAGREKKKWKCRKIIVKKIINAHIGWL